ncbi:UMP-CMP kinase 2, mitochondrial [Poecilia reticulata]|uniref:UMP-CMP kinase 2, mitochondrial n=1 Tax=Poecilia reticulata TaxID=8081 RepID=A0A3P9QBY3_POERE|nr:PREDICTED: UMP-CMP kinase 2, mitochondrial [Poecilia reticulata]XP_008398073.1 PREDICTED: UMP-CMP kinase 2, mitochondrial [Poecilia reticulata]
MARHLKLLVQRWSSRVFSVEVDGAPRYFGVREQLRGEPVPPDVFSEVQKQDRCYSLLVCSGDRVTGDRFHWELRDRLQTQLPPGSGLRSMSSFIPDQKGSLLKGYFLQSRAGNSSLIEDILTDLEQRNPVLVCSYSQSEDGQQWTQCLWYQSEENRVRFCVVPSETPKHHPSVLNMINSDVFYSLQEACDVLKQCGDIIPETRSVLEMLPSSLDARRKPDFPVIVIEGLDATGKTTLTESLRDSLGATLLRSPPQCLSAWRGRFDREPPLIRRAFYAVGNYITAGQINQEASKSPVIVDRFWHSTAAYAIATAVTGPLSNLPHEGAEVYRWPGDLLQPSLVILLTLDPEERKRRLRSRGLMKTDEEEELDHNKLFRLRVEEAYRRIVGPACTALDASPSADLVLQQALLLIRAKCHL